MTDDHSKICKKIFEMDTKKLAFLGDAVYELFVREKLVTCYDNKIGELNKLKIRHVCSHSQSEVFDKIENILNQDELYIYKRGRNTHISKVPKNTTPEIYHKATGLETLFGYLYLTKNIERIESIIKIMEI